MHFNENLSQFMVLRWILVRFFSRIFNVEQIVWSCLDLVMDFDDMNLQNLNIQIFAQSEDVSY